MIGIVCENPAMDLLEEMLGDVEQIEPPASGFYLTFHDDVLMLQQAGDPTGICVESEEIERRLSGPFLLGRACGLPGSGLRVLDATGGLGVDALALARSGAAVDVVEREPMLWALLVDLMRRSEAGVSVTLADSMTVLRHGADYDVIYFDPMFPARRKKALPGKRMQYLSALLADAAAFDPEFVPLAQQRARSRVVLKRRLKDPAILKPDWSLKGSKVRYDVYRGYLAGDPQPSRRTA